MRLEVSRRADLATRAMLTLGRAGRRMKSPELAAALGTTPAFLSQVVNPLVQRGWVRSEPGPTGGYLAVRDLADLSVLDVVEAVEGPTDAGRCVLEGRACADRGPCALHVAWTHARAALVDELARMPLAAVPVRGGAS